MKRETRFALCAGMLALAAPAFASESQFTFITTTDLLPKDKKEIEQWVTWRHQKVAGTYDSLEGRTAFEYGVNDRFQVAAYGIYAWTQAYHNGPDGSTAPPEQFSYDTPDADARYHSVRYLGTAVEGVYRILSPYTDFVGLALYEEPVIGQGFIESESKVILQKNFLDDTLTTAFNFTYAPEWRHLSPGAGGREDYYWNAETDVNYGFGASYRFMPNWSGGFELQNEWEYNGYFWNHPTNVGVYLGPSIHYGGKSFFVSAAAFEQMPWSFYHVESAPGSIVGGRDYDVDFEKYRVRLKVGYYF